MLNTINDNSKSPLIHVKAIKTKYFQVDKHVTDGCAISCNSVLPSVNYTHLVFGKMPQSKRSCENMMKICYSSVKKLHTNNKLSTSRKLMIHYNNSTKLLYRVKFSYVYVHIHWKTNYTWSFSTNC